jgi:erythromycin esterase-like protein
MRRQAVSAFSLSLFLLTTSCPSPNTPRTAATTATPPAEVVEAVRTAAHPIAGQPGDYAPLIDLVGDNRFVLLGEATHGTHEFYEERARITRQLIQEKDFSAIAIEGDWADADRVNRFIRGLGRDTTAEQALATFKDEFPDWMWSNAAIHDLVTWLREHNERLPAERRVGFYGLDLYGLWPSAQAAVEILQGLDPQAEQRARERYKCFEGYRKNAQAYGQVAASRPNRSCQRVALEQVRELEKMVEAEASRTDPARRERLFAALQNARVVKGGEEYFRTLYAGGLSPWNVRDHHMADTLDDLSEYLDAQGKPEKIVVWAHNTHLGDARVTQMAESGELNVGQLMRQRHDGEAVLVGFTTYTGTVRAASQWGDQAQVKEVRPSMPGSYSHLFHQTGVGDFLLVLRGRPVAAALPGPLPERAIGVVYLPQREREQHYFQARLPQQFDAVIHLDETRAVEPI